MEPKDVEDLKKGDYVKVNGDVGKVRSKTRDRKGIKVFVTTFIKNVNRNYRPHEIIEKFPPQAAKFMRTLYERVFPESKKKK